MLSTLSNRINASTSRPSGSESNEEPKSGYAQSQHAAIPSILCIRESLFLLSKTVPTVITAMIAAAGSIPKLCREIVLIMVDRYNAAIPIAEKIRASFGSFLWISNSAINTTPRETAYKEIPLIQPFIKYIPSNTSAVRIKIPPTTDNAMVATRYSAFCFFCAGACVTGACTCCMVNCPTGCVCDCPAVCCSPAAVSCGTLCCGTDDSAPVSPPLFALICCLWYQNSTLLSSSACSCSTYSGCLCILGSNCCKYLVNIGSLDCIRYSLACCSSLFARSCCVLVSIFCPSLIVISVIL